MGVSGGALIVVSLPGDDDAGATKEVTDPYQAVMFRDRTQPDARWFWVNWDMDHSFMDLYRRDLDPWSQDSFSGTIRWPAFEARVIRRLMVVRHLNLDPLHRVRLEGPPGATFRIDDRPVSSGFAGWYRQGTEVVVELAETADRFLHWSVGGRRVPSREVRQRVVGDLVIEAEFRPAA